MNESKDIFTMWVIGFSLIILLSVGGRACTPDFHESLSEESRNIVVECIDNKTGKIAKRFASSHPANRFEHEFGGIYKIKMRNTVTGKDEKIGSTGFCLGCDEKEQPYPGLTCETYKE